MPITRPSVEDWWGEKKEYELSPINLYPIIYTEILISVRLGLLFMKYQPHFFAFMSVKSKSIISFVKMRKSFYDY